MAGKSAEDAQQKPGDDASPGAKGFKDYFSAHAATYAACRPSYPPQLVEYLAGLVPSRELALDSACGTGQLSILLAGSFRRVVAIDASASQIANARPHAGVEYRVAPAEHSGMAGQSVDLITVAQAAHWLDLNRFFAEVQRVARPRAVLALTAYGILHVEGEIDALVQRFYYETIGRYWPPERRLVEDGYRTLTFPFEELDGPHFSMEVSWDLAGLIGYIETWSALREAEKAVGREPIAAFHAELAQSWGPKERRRMVRWPLTMRVGHVQGKGETQ